VLAVTGDERARFAVAKGLKASPVPGAHHHDNKREAVPGGEHTRSVICG
jgi:hypothetical protein